MNIDVAYLKQVKKVMLNHASLRREVIKVSGDALHHAKRAIFALHKGDKKEAKQKLDQSKVLLKKVEAFQKKDAKMMNEGSYKAAVEEFVEASLFYSFLSTGNIGKVSSMKVEESVYIAGLCDVPGELYRYAIMAATNKDEKTVKACVEMGQAIIGELIEFNLTSYLRQKYDQAKKAMQKLEIVQYELSLRK